MVFQLGLGCYEMSHRALDVDGFFGMAYAKEATMGW
jgi:hypothetical protein